MAKARGSRRTPQSGWDALETPVPGDVLACMEELGVEILRVVDNEIVGKCPQHLARTGKEDRHPSWSVNAEEGFFNCFSCGYKGPFVVLVRDMLHVDNETATSWIRQRGGIERVRKVLERHSSGLLIDTRDTTKQINEASLALYVTPPPEALESRGIDEESADYYGVLWEPTKGMWILPIRDPEDGKLWGWQEKNDRYFRNRPTSVKKASTLFGIDTFDSDQVILVESPLDCVYLRSLGHEGALSSFGAGVSDEQMQIIFGITDTLVLALDNDTDGQKYSNSIRIAYSRRGITLRFFDYTGITEKDVGDMTPEQVSIGIGNAYSSVLARF